jgi:hypothetical protein
LRVCGVRWVDHSGGCCLVRVFERYVLGLGSRGCECGCDNVGSGRSGRSGDVKV